VCRQAVGTYSDALSQTVLKVHNLLGVAAVSGNSAIGDSVETQAYAEWVLAPGKLYALVVTNNSGTQTSAYADLFWYEEDKF
jgi:hypothetical protein